MNIQGFSCKNSICAKLISWAAGGPNARKYIYMAPTCGGPGSRVRGTREVRGNHRNNPPTSSRWVPETFLTLARCGTGKRPSGGAVAAATARSGRRSGRRRRHRCHQVTPKSGLTACEFRKERRVKMPWEGETSHGATSPRSSTFTHGAADRYRFYRVRELRLPVREYRPGSIGVHRTRKRSGEEKGAICLASRGPRCL